MRRNNFHSISNLHNNWDQMEIINFNFEVQENDINNNNNVNENNNTNTNTNTLSDNEQFEQISVISEIETEV